MGQGGDDLAEGFERLLLGRLHEITDRFSTHFQCTITAYGPDDQLSQGQQKSLLAAPQLRLDL